MALKTSITFALDFILFYFLNLSHLNSFFFSVCKDRFPLGLATGRIQSHQISASTTFNASGNLHHFGVSQARLGVASFWCGSDKATWKEDWIQVNFDVTVNVTGIAVENGWYDNQNGILREFYLQFSSDGATFNNQIDGNGSTQVSELLEF